MKPIIITIPATKLIGKKIKMSFDNNRTFELWSGFMPRRKEIQNAISNDLYSLQVYEDDVQFSPQTQFTKWALVPVTDFNEVPKDMEPFVLEGGLYAVFPYKGLAADFEKMFRYIFFDWLPNSDYELDNRPHFEILGAKYLKDNPNSEEDIYVPIKLK